MDDRTEQMFNEVFSRLRETEAQTREQNVQLESLSAEIKSLTVVTDKFINHLAKQEDHSEKREQNFFKAMAVLIGAILVLALGPKVAKEIISMKMGTPITAVVPYDIWHGDNNRRYWSIIPYKEPEIV